MPPEAAVHLPVHRSSGRKWGAETALKRHFSDPKCALRPPLQGPLVQPERQAGSANGSNAQPCCSTGEQPMRHVDFSPLYRSTVGFDRLFTMLDSLAQPDSGQILSALQHRAHRRGRLPHLHGRRRLLGEGHRHRGSPQRSVREGRAQGREQRRGRRGALSRHRRLVPSSAASSLPTMSRCWAPS